MIQAPFAEDHAGIVGTPARALWRLRVACWYAQGLSLAVFPCKPEDKSPYTRNGYKNASRDCDQIEEWWTRWPHALIGVATGAGSGVVLVDLDVKDRKDGPGELVRNGWALGRTWIARTRSGGFHAYYQHPGYPVRNSVDWPAEGVDLRGDGGYAIIPGPRDSYRWSALRPGRVPLAPLPPWLVEELRNREASRPSPGRRGSGCGRNASEQPALAHVCDKITSALPGCRQDTLAQQAFRAGRLVREGRVDERTARAAVIAATEAINPAATSSGPWDRRAAVQTVTRCFDAGLR